MSILDHSEAHLKILTFFKQEVSAIYHSTLEQVVGGKYGQSDKQYFIMLDRGGFYGGSLQALWLQELVIKPCIF